jgi:hypothetical protein
MPRIASALAVLLTLVTCIGFNIARYPVVWEMAAPEGFSQASQPEPSTAAPQSAVAASSSAIPNLTLALKSATAAGCETPEAPAADLPPSRDLAETTYWPSAPQTPVAVGPPAMDESFSSESNEQASPGGQDRWLGHRAHDEPATREARRTSIPERPLVAVAPPEPAVDPGARPRFESRDGPAAVACAYGRCLTVRRLPPLDQVWNLPRADDQPPRSRDAILIYPAAGMR